MQILEQGDKNLVVLINAAESIVPSTFGPDSTGRPVVGLTLQKIWYDVGVLTDAALQWVATANSTFFTLSGREDFCFEDFGGIKIPTPPPAGATGAIAVTGTGTFTVVLKFTKNY